VVVLFEMTEFVDNDIVREFMWEKSATIPDLSDPISFIIPTIHHKARLTNGGIAI
jgi:hypothetical protein